MSGTSAGGRKAAIINTNRYGDDYFSKIGKVGGAKGRGKNYKGGFAYVAPGQTENNGKRFAAMGGYLSKRSRKIEVGDKLRNDEINELLKLGVRVLGTMRMEGLIDVTTEHMHHVTLYTEAGDGNWPYIFNDCGIGPQIKIVWAGVLSTELKGYRDLARERFDNGTDPIFTKEESKRFRTIRNLVRAFEAATGIEVQ